MQDTNQFTFLLSSFFISIFFNLKYFLFFIFTFLAFFLSFMFCFLIYNPHPPLTPLIFLEMFLCLQTISISIARFSLIRLATNKASWSSDSMCAYILLYVCVFTVRAGVLTFYYVCVYSACWCAVHKTECQQMKHYNIPTSPTCHPAPDNLRPFLICFRYTSCRLTFWS